MTTEITEYSATEASIVLRAENNLLREELKDCRKRAAMACEEPAGDCQCSGCSLAAELPK